MSVWQDLIKEIEAVDRMNAGLVSSKAILEGELSRFKEYMRETGEGETRTYGKGKGRGELPSYEWFA